MEVLTKLPPIGCLLMTGLSGSMLPMWLELRPMTERIVFRYGNAVAAGVLGAAGFVHLFPDAMEALDDAVDFDFPLAGLLALCGALALLVIDNALQSKAVQQCLPFEMHEHSIHMSAHSDRDGKEKKHNFLVALALFSALSFHSIFEGLALGANVLFSSTFYAIFWAILAHKFFAGLALGISLTRAGSKLTTAQKLLFCTIFSASTPIGALVGIYAGTVYDAGTPAARIIRGSLTALSAGIFIYISFVEIIAGEFTVHDAGKARNKSDAENGYDAYDAVPRSPLLPDPNKDHDGEHILPRLAVLLVSAGMMSALAIWA